MPSREVKEHLGMSRNLAKEPLIRGGFRRTEMGDRPRRDRRLASEHEKLTRHRASAPSSSGKGAGGGKGGGKGKSKDQSARVQHVPVVGKGNTEVGGAYPPDLTDATAKKIIEAWKRILNLEWLWYQLQQKSDKVNKLQGRWLENEEKRRKRVYVEEEPSNTRLLTGEVKARRLVTKATESYDREEEHLPSSSTGPSKKQRRVMNEFAIGGMRNPLAAVSRLHQVRQFGEMIHAAWMDFVTQNPEVLSAAINYGSSEAKFDKDILSKWTERLGSLLEMEVQDGITFKEEVEFRSPLRSGLWERVKSRDPEQCIDQWAREGAPLGMECECEVQESNIFPRVESGEALESKTDLNELLGMKNYESVEFEKEEACVETDRYIARGFCRVMLLEALRERFK